MDNREPKYKNLHQEVIDRCLYGDRKAQYELYRLYSKAMYNTCLRITNDQMEAEDVLQESFVSAFKNISSYKGEASFGSWLKRIVVNNAINLVKKRRIEFQPMEGFETFDEPVNEINDDGQLYDVQSIKRSIGLLPQGYRLVITLYLIEGYDHQEIAGILGITVSTSKSQFNRAKKKLREIIKDQWQHAG